MIHSIISVFILFLLFGVNSAYAHSGGLNKQGCHAGSKPYHCHRTQSEMNGNRLKCSNGSRSSECKIPAPLKPRPDKKHENSVEIPTALKGGLGLTCRRKNKETEIFLLSENKRQYGEFFYHNDKVTINVYNARLYPSTIEMGIYVLKRQTLELTFRGTTTIGKCEVVNPEDVVKFAIAKLAKKLSKNKI